MKNKTKYRLFAACAPGIEQILFQELNNIGIEGKVTHGGVEFSGDLLTIYSTNLWLRTASRVLARIASFPLASLEEAKGRFSRYPWEIYMGSSDYVRVRASCHKSKIYHSGAIAQRLVEAISERLGKEVRLVKESSGKKAPLIFVRIVKDFCVLSIDTSGEHLHKRGFKKFSVKAPLRENLGAAMLIASKYDGSKPLVDPFCGSGTIVLEAAMISARIPPGRGRRFAFMGWRTFDKALWNEVLRRSEAFFRRPPQPILGFDRDEAAIQACIANAEAGGLLDLVNFSVKDVTKLWPPSDVGPGIIVTNPPYGRRLKENNSLLAFYAEFGQLFRERFRGWDLTLILPSEAPMLKRSLGLRLHRLGAFSNGGLPVELLSTVKGKQV
ncbi:MAG: class I SAM-dependent RNA methyltransferase [Thermodesulfobacteria bacterium]|nr:class I SAM-dependent RNA methyltransferase [Thermodesulfobacteriota bacterium]